MRGAGLAGLAARVAWSGRLNFQVLLMGLIMTGCATGPNANPADPLEPLNRSVYKFNDVLDRNVLVPLATTYRDVTPSLVKRGIGNFFGNLEDAWSFVNNVLQLKGEAAAESIMRVSVNTIMGLGGLLDVATEMRIERHTEDFGQTLGYWGVGAGPYIVLPVFGPSDLRDAVALPVDTNGYALTYIEDEPTRNILWVVRAIDQRAAYLQADVVLGQVALDKYSFIRDAYLQRRRNAVYDGNPPEDEPMEEAPAPDSPAK